MNPGSGLKKFMGDDVWEAGMRWALDWPHPNAALRATLYGGEPLLAYDAIREWVPRWNVHFAAERGRSIHWSVTTNGLALARSDVRQFLDRHGVSVLLSLNGPKHLHNASRPRHDGSGSWDAIGPEELARWRKDGRGLEVAWTIEPSAPWAPEDIEALVEIGFKWINFNLDWLVEWSPADQARLTRFMRHAALMLADGRLRGCNWNGKIQRALTVENKMAQPCGTGLGMLALTPEGWLYPSQEMAFTAVAPGQPKELADYYRVGNVLLDPVIDKEAQRRASNIYTKDLKKPYDPIARHQYDCEVCIAKSDCVGGCHCRYIGQQPNDPSYRHDIPLGYCQSNVAAMTGWLQASAISRTIRLDNQKRRVL